MASGEGSSPSSLSSAMLPSGWSAHNITFTVNKQKETSAKLWLRGAIMTSLLQRSDYKTRWTHLNNLVFWVNELDVRNRHANRIALGIGLLGTGTHKRSSKKYTKLPAIFLVPQVEQMYVKTHVIISVGTWLSRMLSVTDCINDGHIPSSREFKHGY